MSLTKQTTRKLEDQTKYELSTAVPYPEPPEWLSDEEALVFENIMKVRNPKDWKSYAEIMLVGQMVQLMVENKYLQQTIDGMGRTYINSVGNESVTAAFAARRQNLAQIITICRTLSLTLSMAGMKKGEAGKRADAHSDKLEREQMAFESPVGGLLARPVNNIAAE